MTSPSSGDLAFGPDWLFGGGGAGGASRRVRTKSGSGTPSKGGAGLGDGAADAAAGGAKPRHVYTSQQILAQFAEGMPVPESLLQFPQIARTDRPVFPQAFTPLTDSEVMNLSNMPINSVTGRGGGGRPSSGRMSGGDFFRRFEDEGKARPGGRGWGATEKDDGEWTHVDRRSDPTAAGGKNTVEVGPDGQRRLVIPGIGNRRSAGSGPFSEREQPGRSASGPGRFGSSESTNWRRGPPRPLDQSYTQSADTPGRSSYGSRGPGFVDEQRSGAGYAADRGGGGGGRMGRGGRGHGEDEDSMPEWATEPVVPGGGADAMGGFGADGTFFASAADAEAVGGALESLDPLEPEPVGASTAIAGTGEIETVGGSDTVDGSRFLASMRSGGDNAGRETRPDDAFASSERPAWAPALVSNDFSAPAQPEPQPVAEEWYYKDLADETQGPFSTAEMADWYSRQFFESSLRIRKGTTADFVPLGRIVELSAQHREAPFTTPVTWFDGDSATGVDNAAAKAREREQFIMEQQERRRLQQEHARRKRQEELEKQRREEDQRLEQKRREEAHRAEQQRLEQQRQEEQQRLEQQRLEQQRLDQQRAEQQRREAEDLQKQEEQRRQQAAQDEAVRSRQAAMQQQLSMLPPQYQQLYMQMTAMFQQQQAVLQHQLMEVNQRMQDIYQTREKVQEAVQNGSLVITEQQHAQIQQQEVEYKQYHMNRIRIWDQNKQLQQAFLMRQKELVDAARRDMQAQPQQMASESTAQQGTPSATEVEPGAPVPQGSPGQQVGMPRAHQMGASEHSSAPAPQVVGAPGHAPVGSPALAVGAPGQPIAGLGRHGGAEQHATALAAAETSERSAPPQEGAGRQRGAQAQPQVPVEVQRAEEISQPPAPLPTHASGSATAEVQRSAEQPKQAVETAPVANPWNAPQDAEQRRASMGEILKQEERRKQREEELARTVQAEQAKAATASAAVGSPAAASSGGSSKPAWGAPATAPSPTKSLDEIQAEEARRAKERAAAAAAATSAAASATQAHAKQAKNAAPVSFLEIQRAEEEAKKALVKRQQSMGIETGQSAWYCARFLLALLFLGCPFSHWFNFMCSLLDTAANFRSSAAAKGAANKPSGFVAPSPQASGGSAWGKVPSKAAQPKRATLPAAAPTQATAARHVPPPSTKTTTAKGGADGGFWDYEGSGRGAAAGGASDGANAKGAFANWCEAELKKLDASLDAETFSQFIISLGDEEVELYVMEHYGGGGGKKRGKAKDFVTNFLDRRASESGTVSATSGWHTAGGSARFKGGHANSGDDGFTEAKGSKGKRKKRGQKIDPKLLTYGVASSGGANRGQLDTWAP